jgi:hypothetical protein
MGKSMKIFYSAILALTIVAAAAGAQARDSFSLGVNVGNHCYVPPVACYPAPVRRESDCRESVYRESVYYHKPVAYCHEYLGNGWDNEYRGHCGHDHN